jgi:hypothetical protein
MSLGGSPYIGLEKPKVEMRSCFCHMTEEISEAGIVFDGICDPCHVSVVFLDKF